MGRRMCKVSVIVPAYNTEKYLRACLESLAAQTLNEIEIHHHKIAEPARNPSAYVAAQTH